MNWLRTNLAFYALLGAIAVAPVLFAVHLSRVDDAFVRGQVAGENAAVARAVAVQHVLVKQKFDAEQRADRAATATRHAEREALQASRKAADASTRLRNAIGRIDTVHDTVVREVVIAATDLLVAVDTLTQRVDSLVTTITQERIAHAALVLTYQQAEDAQRVAFAHVNAQLAKAQRRPTRLAQITTTVAAGAIGYAVGRR